MAGDAQPMESSLSVCMLHTEGELATLQLPCASSSNAMLSRFMSVAMDCTVLRVQVAQKLPRAADANTHAVSKRPQTRVAGQAAMPCLPVTVVFQVMQESNW